MDEFICPKCGTLNEKNGTVCKSCGANFGRNYRAVAFARGRVNLNSKVWRIYGAILLIGFVTAIIFRILYWFHIL